MSPSAASPSPPPALSDVTNGLPPSLTTTAAAAPVTPRKTSLVSVQPSLTPPDTPVTPPSPPYVTATSTPSNPVPANNKAFAAAVAKQQHAVRNVFHHLNHDAQDDQTHQIHHPDDIHHQPNHIVGATRHFAPDQPDPQLAESVVVDLIVEPQAATEDLIDPHPSSPVLNPQHSSPDAPEHPPEPPQTDHIPVESTPTLTESSEPQPGATDLHQVMPEPYSHYPESPCYQHNSPLSLTHTHPPPPLSDTASYNSSPPTPPPVNLPISAHVWTGATHARSPKFRLAAAAAVRASMVPAVSPSPKNTNKPANPPGPFRATRPESPKFQLAAAAALRAASAREQQDPTPKASKPQPAWGATPTVAKSPKLRSVGKALSAAATARKEELLAEQEHHEAEIRRRAERLRASRAAWANTRTKPKSPAVLRHPSARVIETTQRTRFTPTPMPDFGHAPPVKQTRASIARLQRKGSGLQKSMPPRKPQHQLRTAKPLGRTVPRPFPLQGVNKHEEVVESLQRRQQLAEAEERRSRMFEPVPLREEILEGPTFIPSRSDPNLLTDPVSLLPDAEQRSKRTLAYLAGQRERMEEMERRKTQAAREREDRELEDIEREWQQRRFKARPMPKSHYTPDIPPVCSMDGSRSGEREREWFTPGSQSTEEEQVTPAQNDDESVPRRPSLFEGLRKSLSPLLGALDEEKVQHNGEAQR